MPNGVYFGLIYSEGRNNGNLTTKERHRNKSNDNRIRSIVKSILATFERAMYLARQLRGDSSAKPLLMAGLPPTVGKLSQGRVWHQQGARKEEDVIDVLKRIFRGSDGEGAIDPLTVGRFLELAHAEVGRILKRNRMSLKTGHFKGDVLAETLLSDVLNLFNARLNELSLSAFSRTLFVGEPERKTLLSELMDLSRYVAEQTICALLDLERRMQARLPGHVGRPGQLLAAPIVSEAIGTKNRSGHNRSASQVGPKAGVSDQHNERRKKQFERNTPKHKRRPTKSRTKSLSSATTAVPNSPQIAQHPALKPKPAPKPRIDVTGRMTHDLIAKWAEMSAMPLNSPGILPPSPSISMKAEAAVSKTDIRASVFSFPSDSTPFGEIPPHKLVKPPRPPTTVGSPAKTVTESGYSSNQGGGKPGFWRRWIKKTK